MFISVGEEETVHRGEIGWIARNQWESKINIPVDSHSEMDTEI